MPIIRELVPCRFWKSRNRRGSASRESANRNVGSRELLSVNRPKSPVYFLVPKVHTEQEGKTKKMVNTYIYVLNGR